jgi:hypothetical protein
MATISVLDNATKKKLGAGQGSIDTQDHTATINSWTEKAGLQAQKKYTLKSGGKSYSDATCTQVSLPAHFTGVE